MITDVILPEGFADMLTREDWDEVFEDGGCLNRRHIEKIWRKAGLGTPSVDRLQLITEDGRNLTMEVLEEPWPPQ